MGKQGRDSYWTTLEDDELRQLDEGHGDVDGRDDNANAVCCAKYYLN